MKDIELAERLECLALGNPAITFTDKADLALAAARLRKIATTNPAPGYCKHCKQYTIEEPLPAAPAPEPVAWGVPNTAITGKRHALMMVRLEAPAGDPMWIPLYAHPAAPAPSMADLTDEGWTGVDPDAPAPDSCKAEPLLWDKRYWHLSDLMCQWKTGAIGSNEAMVELFKHFSSTPAHPTPAAAPAPELSALADRVLDILDQDLRVDDYDVLRKAAAALRTAAPAPECKCNLRTKLVGDGCEVCNPELAAELQGCNPKLQSNSAELLPEQALREAHAEIERRHGIGGELIIARRERDELRAKVERLRALLRAPPKHSYWGAGEAACPKDIKGSNGELHTLRCRHCGQDSPRSPICLDRIDAELKDKP